MLRLSGLLMLFVLLASVSLQLDRKNPCITPAGEDGQCLFFRECEPLLNIYKKPIVTPEESSFVLESQKVCGDTVDRRPLVCCVVPGYDPKIIVALPEPPRCGANYTDRIDDGQRTSPGEYPWTALIEYRKPNNQTGFHCGASLITSRYVVTAAHCIKAIPAGWLPIGVRLGEWDLNSKKDCANGECAEAPINVGIEKIIVHEDYDPNSKAHYNDIALIRFTRDVPISSFIVPICLPLDYSYRFQDIDGKKAWAAGWGRTETASSSNVKLKVELNIKESWNCGDNYRPFGIDLDEKHICAVALRGHDICSADSGGPLTRHIDSKSFLYGIASFGRNKCGTKSVPGVFTNVPIYVGWIQSNIPYYE